VTAEPEGGGASVEEAAGEAGWEAPGRGQAPEESVFAPVAGPEQFIRREYRALI